MALVYCTKCGHRVSTTAPKCPGCGALRFQASNAESPPKATDVTTEALSRPQKCEPQTPRSATSARDARACPLCGEMILAVATKCRFCGQLLDGVSSAAQPPVSEIAQSSRRDSYNATGIVANERRTLERDLKESGTVTALSVIGLVFGLIGMLGSFIPCVGALAFYIGIPAALVSGIGLAIAYNQNARRTFAIVALTISLIGVVISVWQYSSIISGGEEARHAVQAR